MSRLCDEPSRSTACVTHCCPLLRPCCYHRYIFTNRKSTQEMIVQNTSAGGVTINGTLWHVVRRPVYCAVLQCDVALTANYVIMSAGAPRTSLWRSRQLGHGGVPRRRHLLHLYPLETRASQGTPRSTTLTADCTDELELMMCVCACVQNSAAVCVVAVLAARLGSPERPLLPLPSMDQPEADPGAHCCGPVLATKSAPHPRPRLHFTARHSGA